MKKQERNSMRSTTRRVGVILILFFVSFTGSSQSIDSTLCFTKDQVKTFLRVKVELENCLDVNQSLNDWLSDCKLKNENIKKENLDLQEDKNKLKKQRNRSRFFAIGSGVVAILSTLLLIN